MVPPVFATPPHLYAFYAVVGLWGISEYLGRRRHSVDSDDREDRGSFRVLQVAALVGVTVTMGNWVAVPALALASAVGYGYRISVEESALRTELGEAYDEYAERAPSRLVPGVR